MILNKNALAHSNLAKLEIFLNILGKRKISFLNFNLEAFREGLNWA
jgi:hypothetical protein